MADNRQTVIDLDKKRMAAMAEKDVATLNALLADDLVYTHSSARLDTKQSLIGNMESGATVYTAVEPSDVKAQDLGDAVVLTGSCRISVMSGGRPNNFGVRFTDVYANRGRTLADGRVAVDPPAGITPFLRRRPECGRRRFASTFNFLMNKRFFFAVGYRRRDSTKRPLASSQFGSPYSLALDRVFFEGRAIGRGDQALRRRNTGGGTARDPPGADKFGNLRFAIASQANSL